MITAVDTNALLALLYGDSYADTSETALRRAYQQGRLVTTPIVYAELAADGHFSSDDELGEFLADLGIHLTEPSREAMFRAGEQFNRYVEERPDGLQCPVCGSTQTVHCDSCGSDLTPRQHIAADFLIGGHATVDCEALISFDTTFYETYFPTLALHP